jgi:hypothetical protein
MHPRADAAARHAPVTQSLTQRAMLQLEDNDPEQQHVDDEGGDAR